MIDLPVAFCVSRPVAQSSLRYCLRHDVLWTSDDHGDVLPCESRLLATMKPTVVPILLCAGVKVVGGFNLPSLILRPMQSQGRRQRTATEVQPRRQAKVREQDEDNNNGDSLHGLDDVNPYGLLSDKDSQDLNLLTSEVGSFYRDDDARLDPDDREQEQLELAIDSFLNGDSDRISATAPIPHPDLSPSEVVDQSLRALRLLDTPFPSHGAAVFQSFLVPLTRGQRWGDSSVRSTSTTDPWKEIQRGALTASMMARGLRASPFSGLLDWKRLDVSDGAMDPNRDVVGNPSVAFVTAALHFGRGVAPILIQFTLQRVGGLWLIDSAKQCPMNLFTNDNEDKDDRQR